MTSVSHIVTELNCIFTHTQKKSRRTIFKMQRFESNFFSVFFKRAEHINMTRWSNKISVANDSHIQTHHISYEMVGLHFVVFI